MNSFIDPKNKKLYKIPLKVVFIYIIFGISWILFSDQILSILVTDYEQYKLIQSYKGFFYVLITAILLFVLIKIDYNKIYTLAYKVVAAQDDLEKLYASEKKRLEYLLSQKDETLSMALYELVEKEKMASLGNLVAGISHEINTPLGIAISAVSFLENIQENFLEKVQNQTLTKKELLNHLEKIDETTFILTSNLNRASELVKSFKAISINQNIDDIVLLNLKNYLDTIFVSLKHEYKNKGHIIEIECDENLMLYTRPGAISQIITNLFMNSLIHGFEEGESGIIHIIVKEEVDTISIIYEDNGKGMTKEVLSRIYEPFFTTNRDNGGSGLGLNIVYNLVKHQLLGSIYAESEVGKFSRFTIKIPKRDSDNTE
ncbi:MAG: sensor histidine kinase [Proteocatella sp.]